MRSITFAAGALLLACACSPKQAPVAEETFDIPLDSILMSDPFILADSASGYYYMTGTGGKLYKSPDLAMWSGPYEVAQADTTTWIGAKPHIWAAEIHKVGDKYYYFATFTNDAINFVDGAGHTMPRRASHVLVSDSPEGPYTTISGHNYTPDSLVTLDGTLWYEDGKPYMVYCGEWIQNNNGTIEAIELLPDLSGAAGEPTVLFRASDNPWSREVVDGQELGFNRVTDGPWLFRTDTGRLGMLWTSWIYNVYTMGVAYSESGRLEGPWTQADNPVTEPDYGHGMLFRTFDGRDVLSLHSHSDVNGRYIRRPTFWTVDLSGDSLKIVDRYIP